MHTYMFAFYVFLSAYANGMRRGVVPEKPFRLGDTIRNELETLYSSDPDNTVLDIEKEIKLAFNLTRRAEDTPSYTYLKDLGLQR
jgi:alcohol-forming fatty acyl-CoA reductase